MNFSDVMLVIEKILETQSDQELALILDDYPALAKPETLEAMRESAEKAFQNDEIKTGESLQAAAEIISSLTKNQSRWSETNIKPQVLWAIKARKCLALLEPELLNEAIAEAAGETEIVDFLRAFAFLIATADGDFSEIDKLADNLIQKCKQENRREEALTVNLVYLDTRVSLLESYRRFPVIEQEEMKNLGIKACRQAIQISGKLSDRSCEAFYCIRLADCFRYSQQPGEAEQFYQRALPIYRELAGREPQLFNRRLAMTLSCLGVIQIYLEKLTDAEISIGEAVRLYRELAEQKPRLFKEKLEIALNNLNAVQILQQESINE